MCQLQWHPAGKGQQAGTDGHDHQEPDHHRLRGIGAGQQADRDRGYGIGGGRGQHHQPRHRNEAVHARPQHDQHADQADADGHPAPRPDPFAQQRHRQRSDQQRGDEIDGVGSGQRQVAQGEHEAADHRHAQRTTQQVQPPAARHQ